MGGGMVYGEPFGYGFRYPYGANRTPGNTSAFLPRRQSSLWDDPEELTNLARKRKLDRVKGEPLVVSNGKNVREILVEDPSVSRISITHDLQAHGNAPSSRRNSPSASSPSRSTSPKPSEGHTVTIPVVFSTGAANQQPVSVVPPERMKKPRRTISEEAAAVLIQSTYRGYAIRRTKPLEHMHKINSISIKLKEFEQHLSDASIIQKMRTDVKVRLRITEGIMALLLQLDSIQGVHSDVRVWRKRVTKDVVTLQERVDALLKGGATLGTESACVESSVHGHDEDGVMALEENNVAKDDGSENYEMMTEHAPKESQPETQDKMGNLAKEIVRDHDQVQLEDNEGVPQSGEMAVVEDECYDSDERLDKDTTDISDRESDQCAIIIEPIMELKLVEKAEQDGAISPRSEIGRQQTRSISQGVDSKESAHCETEISVSQFMNDICEILTDTTGRREEESRPEASLSCVVEEAKNDSNGETDGVTQMKCSEAIDVVDSSMVAEGEQGMVVNREEFHPQNQGDECVGCCEEFDCSLKPSPREQEKMKDFLKEISNPSETMSPRCIRLSGAEDMDCLGAPGTCSDFEVNDGAVASSSPAVSHFRDDADGEVATSEQTEKSKHDPLLLKLSEENKMLKSLLLDVMKWNQLQATKMKNVTERLGKLEGKLMGKKTSSKFKAHRCTRSRLERRLR